MLNLRPHPRRAPARGRAGQRGLSIMELMVGAAVGMVVISGALMLFAKNVSGSRMLLAETRLNQDLRNAADLVSRDIRRAGYWGNAILGTTAIGGTSLTMKNEYSAVTPGASEINYTFSLDPDADNNVVDKKEQAGFRLTGGALQMREGDNWTDVTDKASVNITSFAVTPTETVVDLRDVCPNGCPPGTPNCPTATVRSYAVVLHGQSVRDANVQRSLRSTVRVRNDQVAGTCPA